MNEQLSHAEAYIISQGTGQCETPIMDYLRDVLCVISDDDKLPDYVPNTVLIQHYVQFRLILREWVLNQKSTYQFYVPFISSI